MSAIQPTKTAADWHRRQRDLVAASLVSPSWVSAQPAASLVRVPGASRPTHRRWA